MPTFSRCSRWLGFAAALLFSSALLAQDAEIRKALAERVPRLPKIDEIRATPVPGIYEVRYGGTEILYSDAKGEYVFNGSMLDTKTLTDLTEARINQLTAVEFAKLPLKDAMVVKQGNGSRRLAVFADPNCGFCKRFERDLTAVKNVTIYTFLMPILSTDSVAKSRDIWCTKDPMRSWRAWMLDNVTPPKAAAGCDSSALERNLALSRTHRITGTPALFFEDSTRMAGALGVDKVEQLLAAAAARK